MTANGQTAERHVSTSRPSPGEVALFATCLIDLFRPSAAFAAIDLLRAAGCDVAVPDGQSCCGQPAYNSGDRRDARALARQTIDLLMPYRFVVVPSASCAGMLRNHYPKLLSEDPVYRDKAAALCDKTYELSAFLAALPVQQGDTPGDRRARHITYHDSCSALREVGVDAEPRTLIDRCTELKLTESAEKESCCGFGGTFCVKYDEISTHMADRKLEAFVASGAQTVTALDLGCLLHLAGRARRRNLPLEFRHLAEVLAGCRDAPPIAASKDRDDGNG